MSHPPSFFYSGPLLGSPASARSGPWLPPIGQTASPFSPAPLFFSPAMAAPLPPLLIGGTFDSHAQLRTMQPSAMISSSSSDLSDPFSSQIMNRRFHLLIRSAPTDSNSSVHHRSARKPLEPSRLMQIGSRRIAQTTEASVVSGTDSSAVIRNQSRLARQFGGGGRTESSSARKARRARRREEEALAAEQRHIAITTRDRQREANRPAKLNGPSQAALQAAAAAVTAGKSDSNNQPSSATASASSNVAVRHRKQILHFLTSTSPAPKHRFFAHLPRPPVLSADTARSIYDEIGTDALEHLRILSAQGGQYASLHELMQALRQSAVFEQQQRESAERQKRNPFPEQALLEGRGVGNAFDVTLRTHDDHAAAPPSGAFASEQERAIAAVSSADRDRLVAFLTSSSCHLFSDAVSEENEGDDAEAAAAAAEVTATPREIAQLIVENGGIERTLHTLSTMDAQIAAAAAASSCAAAPASVSSSAAPSSRGFDSFQSLAPALRAQAASREEIRRTKEALREYFARGAEMWRRERNAAARNGNGSTNGHGGKHKDAAAAAASEPASLVDPPTAATVSPRTPRRDMAASAPPTCRLFLHLPQFPLITAADIDRLVESAQAGCETLQYCRSLDAVGVRLASFQDLIDRVREMHREAQGGQQGQQLAR